MYHDTVLDSGIKKGDFIDDTRHESLLAQDQFPIAKQKALHYIGYRPRATAEIRKKLKSEDFSESVIEKVIERLSELGFLNDLQFAEAFSQSRLRKYGQERIKMDLRRLGISDSIIQNALSKTADEDQIQIQVEELAEKLLLKYQKEPDLHKRRQKLYAALIRRGYRHDVVGEVVRQKCES